MELEFLEDLFTVKVSKKRVICKKYIAKYIIEQLNLNKKTSLFIDPKFFRCHAMYNNKTTKKKSSYIFEFRTPYKLNCIYEYCNYDFNGKIKNEIDGSDNGWMIKKDFYAKYIKYNKYYMDQMEKMEHSLKIIENKINSLLVNKSIQLQKELSIDIEYTTPYSLGYKPR